jgi:O-acetyl-ADP-ribose deacetylase (regulator of RNase III)
MGQDLRTDAEIIRAATASALSLAASRGLSSIAFPALGTGVGGFSIAECARVMIRAAREHAAAGTSLRLVEFVLFGREAYEEFSRGAQEAVNGP